MFNIKFSVDKENPVVISFKTMRRMIGILGIALPVLLFVWSVCISNNHFLLDSISSYYHTYRRDWLVGILCAVSLFLFAYHGYDNLDFVVFKIAAISALGVAFFPAFIKSPINPDVHIAGNATALTNAVHYVSASIFFITLACVSLFLFTKTGGDPEQQHCTKRKVIRNRLYIVCGLLIFASIIFMAILMLLPPDNGIFAFEPAFWAETVALFAFGTSWLVKGEALLKDKKKA